MCMCMCCACACEGTDFEQAAIEDGEQAREGHRKDAKLWVERSRRHEHQGVDQNLGYDRIRIK